MFSDATEEQLDRLVEGFAARSMMKASSSITVNHELLNTMAIARTGGRYRRRPLRKSPLSEVGNSGFAAWDIQLFPDWSGTH